MPNLTIRRDRGTPAITQPDWDPFRALREMIRWDPFAEMAPAWPTEALAFNPPFEIKETKDGYLFKADMPGVQEKDLDITVTGNRVTVAGKREAEQRDKTDTYYAYERTYGAFTRAFTLPEGADAEHVRAELKDGVLTVLVPKLPAAQARKVTIKAEKAHA